MEDLNIKNEFARAGIVSALALQILLLFTPLLTPSNINFLQPWDHHKYIAMAESSLFELRTAPFCWRILNPFIAGILPFSLEVNFLLLTCFCLWLTATLFYFFLRLQGFSKVLSLAGILFFWSLGWASRFNIFDFWLTDPMAFLFTMLAVLCLVTKRDLYFCLALFIGVLAKESVIFTAPLYYTLKTKKFFDPRLALRGIALALPAITILCAFRYFLPGQNGDPVYLSQLTPHIQDKNPYAFSWLFHHIGIVRIKGAGIATALNLSIKTFGITLSVLPFFAFATNVKLFKRYFPLVFCHYLSILFAVNTERLIVGIFPILIFMALNGAKNIHEKYHVPEFFFLILAFMLVSILPTWPGIMAINLLTEAITLATIVLMIFFYRRRTTSSYLL